MKKLHCFVAVIISLLSVSCSKDSSVATGASYTIEIAPNKYAELVTTNHTVFEYDEDGNSVGRQVINSTENGVSKTYRASSGATYLTVRMDMYNKGVSGEKRSFYYSYMYILDEGKSNKISLDGSAPVQVDEPRLK